MNSKTTMRLVLIGAAAAMTAACDEDTTAYSAAGGSLPTIATNQPSNVRTNAAPVIAGVPPQVVTTGSLYQFRPSVADPDGDALTYTIANRPPWAAFDRTSGRLQGIPGTADVGTYDGIQIAVTDGRVSAKMQPFAILVRSTIAGGMSPGAPPPAPADPVDPVANGAPPADDDSSPTFINAAPKLSGAPATSVLAGTPYSFQPTASDADGDVLTFTISNKPAWAAFNAGTGRLQGTPLPEHVGTYANVTIKVSDGQTTTSLPAFAIAVNSIANGSATLSWTAPTQNEDGSPLTTLAGYKIHWGSESGDYSSTVTIENPGVTTYVVENLVAGTYYFATSAFTSEGLESEYSAEASTTID